MLKFPFATFGEETVFDAYGIESANGGVVKGIIDFPVSYIVLALMILTLLVIFLFKQRKMQIILTRMSYILILGLIVLLYLNIDKIPEGLGATIEYGIGLYVPVAALAFNFLASRAIKNDEKLVRSLDRLR